MKLAAIGSNCIDFYDNLDGGSIYPGGGPVNMAVYTCRLGGSASYIGPVGNDSYGRIMQESIAKKGVNVSHLHIEKGKTAVSQVHLVNGERYFGDYDEGVLANYTLSTSDTNFICTHDMVVCDLWGKVQTSFKELKRRGIRTAFDCATRPDDKACQEAIPYTDYLFFSTDGMEQNSIKYRMEKIQQLGPKMVIAMMGEKGSLCWDGKRFYNFGIIHCNNLVDTMGAGDSYIAGFLYALQKGLPIEKCMEKGAATATDTLMYFGAWKI
jgi:fructoselysine 6-kinase